MGTVLWVRIGELGPYYILGKRKLGERTVGDYTSLYTLSTGPYGRISSPSQTLGKGVKLGERTVDDYIGV